MLAKNLVCHIFFVSIIIQSSMFTMRRLQKPLIRSNLFKSGRKYLLPGQEHHPLWLQANRDVENIKKQFQLPTLTLEQIEYINQAQAKNLATILKILPPINLNLEEERQRKIIEDRAKELFKLHKVGNDKNIVFISSADAKNFLNEESPIFVAGNTLLITTHALSYPHNEITAAIEHEIGHLITNDISHSTIYQNLLNPADYNFYVHVTEKRADTHSGIQSKKNVEELMNRDKDGHKYYYGLKFHELSNYIKHNAPHLLKNKNFEILRSQSIINQSTFEQAKAIAIIEYKKRTIKPHVLRGIIDLCDQPTYIENLMEYHEKQEQPNLWENVRP